MTFTSSAPTRTYATPPPLKTTTPVCPFAAPATILTASAIVNLLALLMAVAVCAMSLMPEVGAPTACPESVAGTKIADLLLLSQNSILLRTGNVTHAPRLRSKGAVLRIGHDRAWSRHSLRGYIHQPRPFIWRSDLFRASLFSMFNGQFREKAIGNRFRESGTPFAVQRAFPIANCPLEPSFVGMLNRLILAAKEVIHEGRVSVRSTNG